MDNPGSGTKYYMTAEFQKILVAEKYRDQVSVMGGGSKWFEPSMNLLDSAKTMYDYTSAYSLRDGDGQKPSVKERAERLNQGGLDPLPIDIDVLAAALEDPDPENGIFERALITGDPLLAKVAKERGVKVIMPEDFLKQGQEQGLLGKNEVELMKKSTKDHQTKLAKTPRSFDPDRAVESEKRHIMEQRRQRRQQVIRPNELQQVQQAIQVEDDKAEKRERRKAMKLDRGLGDGLG